MTLMNKKEFVAAETLLHSPSTNLEPAGCLCCSPFNKVANKDIETESHAEALAQFRDQVRKRQPKLSVITGVMSLDGRVDLIG